jgi:lipopolysaccharide/colanic/teichoic acid biosynthesis glycosyltransferase
MWVLKVRTMWGNSSAGGLWPLVEYIRASDADCLVPKTAKDPRVTNRFAALCRRLSVDELPQLWHVIRGEMALVGPRPLTRYELNTYYGSAATTVLKKKPGLSGLWQISGRSRLSYAQRRRLDLFMIRKWSVSLYCRILLKTIPRVLVGKDAW